MASCFDVVHPEDNICVSCKDVKKQGSLRYYMLSGLITMVEIFHALHSLWVTLSPFALLWWNVMLYATCAKYYSWNRSRLQLQTAGQSFYGIESCSFIEVPNAEEGEKSPFSRHQRGSSAEASHAGNREVSIFSLHRLGACAAAVYAEKRDVGSISYQQREPHHGFGVCVDPFPHQSGLLILDRCGDVTSACLEESHPHYLNQFEEQISCETTLLASKAQAIVASLRASKLSSLCFLEGRGHQVSVPLKGCHWATCSCLLPHQVRPLAMLDVHRYPQIPLEFSCLQVNFYRNRNMLHLKVPMLADHISINWSMLRQWLQTFNGGCVPALNCAKKNSELAWNCIKLSTSQTRNDNHAVLQFILSTTEGSNIFSTISSYDDGESVTLSIGEQRSLWDLSGCKMKSNISFVDNEGSGLDTSEDLGSVCGTSVRSDDECNGAYCTGADSTMDKDEGLEDLGSVCGTSVRSDDECNGTYCTGADSTMDKDDECNGTYCTGADSTMDKDEGLEDSGAIYGKQGYGENGYYCYSCCCGYEDTGIDGVEDAEDADGSFIHPAMDKGDRFYDCSACCDVGSDGPHCIMDVDGVFCMDYDAADGDYSTFDGNVEGSGAGCGDFYFVYEDRMSEKPSEKMQIHVAKLDTWWDEDVVLIDKQESEEDSVEQEWQVV